MTNDDRSDPVTEVSPPPYLGAGIGTFGVAPDGGAGYTIPLRVPPGTAGVQPQLSLAYNSGLRNGLMGAGFSITGLSAITRVGATLAQDGFYSAVSYQATDRLSLDGKRLMPVAGTGYFDDAVYHTEIESWKKVVPSYEGAQPNQHGPVYFTVHDRDGKVYQYGDKPGGTSNASIPVSSANPSVRVWALAAVTDRNGNTMTFVYDPDTANNVNYPSQINYTENTGLAASRSVEFNYSAGGTIVDRNDPFTICMGGGPPIVTTRLLQSIQTQVKGAPITTWSFVYQYGLETGRAQLISVTESGSDGGSLPPTTFVWQDGAPGLSGAVPLTATAPSSRLIVPMDLDGSGLTDLIVAIQGPQNSAGLTFLQSTGTDFQNLGNPLIPSGTVVPYGTLIPMDVNGDGAMDLVIATQEGQQVALTILMATQSEGTWGLALSGQAKTMSFPINASGGGPNVEIPWGPTASLDINGDGMAGLVVAGETAGKLTLWPLLSNGTSFYCPGSNLFSSIEYSQGQLIALDANGDGMSDVLYVTPDGAKTATTLFLSTGSGFEEVTTPTLFSPQPVSGAPLIALDINGDGKDDFLQIANVNGQVQLQTWLSNGGTLSSVAFGNGQTLPLPTITVEGEPMILPMDINGDGLPDVVIADPQQQTALYVLRNVQGTFSLLSLPQQQPPPSGAILLPMDINGDGKTELVAALDGSDLSFSLVSTLGPYPDLISEITNPLGGQVNVTYLPLTDPTVYSPDPPAGGVTACAAAGSQPPSAAISTLGQISGRVSGATYTLNSVVPASPGSTRATKVVDFPKHVVSQYTKLPGTSAAPAPDDDLPEQTYTWTYQYAHALLDLTGRGWLGFAQMVILDEDIGTTTTTTFNQPFPCTNNPSTVTIASAAADHTKGKLMKTMAYGYNVIQGAPVAGTTVWQVQPQTVTTDFYTFADPANPVPDNTLNCIQTYGDYGNLATLEESGSAYGKPLYVSFTYENRPDDWLLGFLTRQTTTADAEGNDVLADRIFTYGPRMNLTSVSDRVSATSSDTVLYRYDRYGNCIVKTDASGAKTRIRYDATQTFPIKVTSPPNAAGKRLVLERVFDVGSGQWTESRDWNGVVRNQVLDGLGRVTAVIGPVPSGKGTMTLRSLVWGNDGGLYQETDSATDWDDKRIKWVRHYLDGFGRVFRTTSLGPDGKATTLVEQIYNSANAIVRQSLPHYEHERGAYLITHYDPYLRPTRVRRVSSTGSVIATMSYPRSNVMRRVDAVGTAQERKTEFRYDAYAGKRVVMSRIDDLGAITRFEYDPLGRLRTVLDPIGVKTSLLYDGLGRVVSSTQANGTKTFRHETTKYLDSERQVLSSDALHNRILSTYDQLGRLIQRSAQLGAGGSPQITTFDWDTGTKASFSKGRLSSVNLPDGTPISYAYDAPGNRRQTRLTLAGVEYEVGRSFTPLGDPAMTRFPDGTTERFQRNASGALTAVSYGSEGEGVSVSYRSLDAFGNAGEVRYGNGVTEGRLFDDLNRFSSLKVNGPQQQALLNHSYQYYPTDAISNIVDNIGNAGETYQYDGVGRLWTATGAYGSLSFTYDNGGNIQTKDGITYTSEGQQVETGQDGSGTMVFSASYDENGCMKTASRNGVSTTYTYDALDQIVAIGDVTLTYDPAGRRLSKSSPELGTVYFVAPDYCVYANPDGTQTSVRLIAGSDGVRATYTAGSSSNPDAPPPGVEYLHRNHIGSVALETDGNGNPSTLQYAPYGQQQQSPPPVVTPTFTGKPFDAESQLYCYGNRYLDPGLGRFLTPNSISSGSLLRADTFHGYAYRFNDPTNVGRAFTDMTFRSPADFRVGGGTAFGILPFNSPSVDQWFHDHWKEILSYAADGVLIVAGLAITAATFGGATVIGATLIGAGVSGLVTNISESVQHKPFDAEAWGISLGVGAVSSFVGGGLGAAIDVAAAPAEEAADAVVVESIGPKVGEDALSRIGTAAFKEAFTNSVGSGVSTIVNNVATGKSALQGVGQSMAVGAVLGAASGGLSDSMGTAYDDSAADSVYSNKSARLVDVLEILKGRSQVVRALPGVLITDGAQDTTQYW